MKIQTLVVLYAVIFGVAASVVAGDTPQGPAAGVVVAGQSYVHRFAASKFDVGANSSSAVDGDYIKSIGEKGVFGQHSVTGATSGVRSAPKSSGRSDADKVMPALGHGFTEDPDESNARVRAYFIGAGLPQEEIGGTHVTTALTMGVDNHGKPDPTRLAFLWYTSHMERRLSGIPVESSYAYAAFDEAGATITEGVFWPAIPVDVVEQALALSRLLADGPSRAHFLNGFDTQARQDADANGEVRIVHTGSAWTGGFRAAAVFTFLTGTGKARVHRLDAAGSPLALPDEPVPPKGSDPASKR